MALIDVFCGNDNEGKAGERLNRTAGKSKVRAVFGGSKEVKRESIVTKTLYLE